MPPQKIFPEQILNTAFTLAREGGLESVLVRAIAENLDCSVQPIYSHFESADGLRSRVCDEVDIFVHNYLEAKKDPDDPFDSLAYAVIQLAKDEPALFKIFFQRERDLDFDDTIVVDHLDPVFNAHLMDKHGLTQDQARTVMIHVSTYTLGLCGKIATRNIKEPEDFIVKRFFTVLEAMIAQVR